MNGQALLDREALDALVRTLPVHVLWFDGELICRYAAPAGTHFLGSAAGDLLGKPVELVLPASSVRMELRPHLERVQRHRQPLRLDRVPYSAASSVAVEDGAWTLHAQPYTPAAPRGRSDSGSAVAATDAPGVLICCFECDGNRSSPNPELQTGESEDKVAEPDGSLQSGAPEGHRAAALVERVRTKLTVIRGFAQLLHRRLRHMLPNRDVCELERISTAISELDRLLSEFEQTSRDPQAAERTPNAASQGDSAPQSGDARRE